MSHDRPTPEERAKNAAHDPLTCPTCLNAELHGDQAEDPVEMGLRTEIAALKRERDGLRLQLADAAKAEREACAKLIDEHEYTYRNEFGERVTVDLGRLADIVRARGDA